MDEDIRNFANAVLPDWQEAMDKFFRGVEKAQTNYGLSDAQVRAALVQGYGSDVADDWDEWLEA